MNKKIKNILRLKIFANKASPTPPVGPALGQAGVNIMDFCKKFNAITQNIRTDYPITVIVTVFTDRSYDFIINGIPSTFLIKKAAESYGNSSITLHQIYEIAKIKKKENDRFSVKQFCSMFIGTAKSMELSIIV